MQHHEEEFVHFVECINWLDNAWILLQLLKSERDNSLYVPAYRFAIVEYSKPYNLSYGESGNYKLDESYIPKDMIHNHERIKFSRNKRQAHSDLTLMEAKVHVYAYGNDNYALIAQNKLGALDDLPPIDEFISLVEGTLDNMYIQRDIMEKAL